MSHKGRSYPQWNRKWLTVDPVVPHFAPLHIEANLTIDFGAGAGDISIQLDPIADDPIGFTITWEGGYPLPGSPDKVRLIQSVFGTTPGQRWTLITLPAGPGGAETIWGTVASGKWPALIFDVNQWDSFTVVAPVTVPPYGTLTAIPYF